MITGFNTDVRQGETVYHVQTEDKGATNPLILSLIYVKGTILDAFRTRYQWFLNSTSYSEKLLQRILEFQHRQIVAAIKKGKYQKGMLLEAFVDGDFIFQFQLPQEASGLAPPPELAHSLTPERVDPPSRKAQEGSQTEPPPIAVSDAMEPSVTMELPPLETTTKESLQSASIDVAMISAREGIEICVEGSKDFVGGELVDLSLFVQTRRSHLRIENVQVVIKIIGTSFSPRLYAGKTDRSGSLRLGFSLPTFAGGSAALIIQASTPIGSDEIKYLVKRRR